MEKSKQIIKSLILIVVLFGCEKEKEVKLTSFEVDRLERLKIESIAISKVLEQDDSSFHMKPKVPWRHFRAFQQWDEGMPLESDSSTKHIYIGIIDKYYPELFVDKSFVNRILRILEFQKT